MASHFSTVTTLSCTSTNAVPKLSIQKLMTNRFCFMIDPLIVMKASSSLVNTTPKKPVLFNLFMVHQCQQNLCFFIHVTSLVARAHAGNDPDRALDAAADGDRVEDRKQDTGDSAIESGRKADDVEIYIENTGKNSRRIRSKVVVCTKLQTLWDILTDYERLADFIPNLASSQLLEKKDKFARLFQVGQQDLAFGLKFSAKGTIDCFEKDLQTLPFCQKREIEFKMVEGDFQFFEGKWSVEQVVNCNLGDAKIDSVAGQEFHTTLEYVVEVKPKLWLPVRLVEGRLCKEITTNLSCIRQEAEKAFQNAKSAS